MKKILLIFICLLLIGCSSVEKKKYDDYILLLRNSNISSDIPFSIQVYLDKLLDDEISYRVIIDNPKYDLFNVEALAIHNIETNDIFPSIGIFDETVNLVNEVKNINDTKGIILTGYISTELDLDEFDAEFRVLVKYSDSISDHLIIYSTKK